MAYDIRLAKLINGEIIIGKWEPAENKAKDVAVIQTVPTQQGVQMVILPFGYPFDTELTAEISLAHVMYEYKRCPEELKTRYMEATSNLTLSTAGDLRSLNLAGGKGKGGPDLSRIIKK
jgi:hypothetical protein